MNKLWTPFQIAFGALLAFLTPLSAMAVTCTDIVYHSKPYSICEVASSEDLRLFLNDQDGEVISDFSRLEAHLGERTLSFSMNAGMYHKDRSPVGYYVEGGTEFAALSDGGGFGNFGLLPNGVFCISDRLRVWESAAFAAQSDECEYATQSGPMLVIDGALHPRFLPDSTSRYVRNGVGTSADGARAFFVISQRAVTFYEFALLFRDYLEVPSALFLDANVSRLHAPSLGRSDLGPWVGPMFGVVE